MYMTSYIDSAGQWWETTAQTNIFHFSRQTITLMMSMCKYIWQEEACSQKVDSNSERKIFISIDQCVY